MSLLLLKPVTGTAPPAGSGEPPAGDNNPDNYDMATETYLSSDFSTEDSEEIRNNPGLVQMDWGADYGYSGGAWRAIPDPTDVGENEDNAGWYRDISDAVDDKPFFTVSYMFYITSTLVEDIENQPEGFWGHSAKVHDHYQYAANGSGADESNGTTRWNIHVRNEGAGSNVAAGAYFSHVAGGAGGHYYDEPTNLPLSEFADEWVWICHVFDGPNVHLRTYIKRQGDSGVTRMLSRDGSDNPGGTGALSYNGRGFLLGEGRTAWGFWDDMIGSSGLQTDRYVALDNLRYANGWVDPPF